MLYLLALSVVVGVVLDLTAVTSWLLVAATLAVVALALGQSRAWTLAVAGAVVGTLSLSVFLARVLQPIPVELDVKVRFTLLLIAAVGLIALWAARERLAVATATATRSVLIFVLPVAALVIVLLVLVTVSAPDGSRISWAMMNDAVWNTITARFINDDSGLGSAHPNSSPLTGLLLAVASSTGRGSVAVGDLLLHDVTRQAQLWLLLILVSSVLSGLVARSGLRVLSPVARALGSVAVACIPLSSFVIGYAFQFGFYNATLVLIVLLCSWIAWMHSRRLPLGAIAVLSAGTIAMLSAWAPLAIVPLALAAGVLVRGGKGWAITLRGPKGFALGGAVTAVLLYGLTVTLPDALREGSALSTDGGIFGYAAVNYVIVVAVTLAVLFMTWRKRRESLNLPGMAIVVLAGGIGLAYLVSQRLDVARPWGYYPIKYAWLLATLMIIVLAVAMLSWIGAPRAGTALRTAGVSIVTAAVILGLLNWPTPTEKSLAAPLSVVDGVSSVSSDTVKILFAESDPAHYVVLGLYSADPSDDQFANSWLIQQHATENSDPIRAYGYVLDGTAVNQICELAGLLPARLTVLTRAEPLPANVAAACPELEVNVVVS
ncbi:MAG: hypothetical protein ACOH10_05080 [Rhodoglobus sp.]